MSSTQNNPHDFLKEYRCSCGKLLFRGALFCSVVEIKCKRCGLVQRYKVDSAAAARRFLTFTLVVGMDGRVIDASNGIAMFGYEHRQLVGKMLTELFPGMSGAMFEKIPEPVPYHIPRNVLTLGDSASMDVESYVAPIMAKGGETRYRIFTISEGR